MDHSEIIPALVEALEDEDATARSHVAQVLTGFGERAVEALPALAKLLEDERSGVSVRAAAAIGAIGEKARAVGPKVAVLLNRQGLDAADYETVVDALIATTHDDGELLSFARQVLNNRDAGEGMRQLAIRIVSSSGEAEHSLFPRIVEGLNDKDDRVREAAITALSQSRAPGNVLELARTVMKFHALDQHQYDSEIKQAIDSLTAQGESAREAVPMIVSVIEKELSKIGTNESVDEEILEVAVRALQNLGLGDSTSRGILVSIFTDHLDDRL